MRVKWNGKTINVVLEKTTISYKPLEYRWSLNWNDYVIEIVKDKWYRSKPFTPTLWNPNGGIDVDGGLYKTLTQAVQVCFDNINYPLMSVNDEEDE